MIEAATEAVAGAAAAKKAEVARREVVDDTPLWETGAAAVGAPVGDEEG